MKPNIHPTYQEATVTCACGNTFTTRSTRREIRTDICGVCHPFYTGEQRIIDTAGQVERFMRRMEATQGDRRPSKRQLRVQARVQAAEEQQRQKREAEARERAASSAQRANTRTEQDQAQPAGNESAAEEAVVQAEAAPTSES